jgi:2,4-dienoyl-CoA reductase (NADPH2)
MFKLLFTPIRVGSMELRNRIVMPAMHFLAAEGGRVLPRHIDYFAERARGGAGLIIIGGCTVDELSGPPEMISTGDDRFIAGLSELAGAVKTHGTKIAGQLYHAGRYAHSSALGGRKPVSSSPVRSKLTGETPRELTIPEIQEIQEHFAAAARRLIQAGFDAVEVIASAGYLISQFLSPLVNRRSDPYGGNVENRMRFGIEVAGRIRREIGSHVPLSFRVAGNEFMEGGLGNQEMQVFCRKLEKAGVDMINVTGGWHETRVPQITMGLPRGGFIYLAQGIRQAVSIPVMASNRICDPRLADQILRDGQADLIGFGRALIADPDLPRKALAGLGDDINFCIACNQGCFDPLFEGKPVTCLVNARAGAERETPLEPASRRKKVMVIGGGPAGLEVARVAALRGHEVSLYEKEKTLGGQLHLAAIPPGREEFLTFVRYLEKQMQKLKVQVHTQTEVTPLQVEREKPEAVVIATGAEPFWPEIPGIHLPHVHLARDLLSGRVDAGKEVVVIGGGAVGLETALFLAQKGTLKPEALHFLMFNEAESPQTLQSLLYRGLKKITVVEMLPRMGMDLGRSTRWTILQDLSRFGVQMINHARAKEITTEGVTTERHEKELLLRSDTVVIAAGACPRRVLFDQLKDHFPEVYLIGDAQSPRTALAAVTEAMAVGRKI